MNDKTKNLFEEFFKSHIDLIHLKNDILNAVATVVHCYKSGGKLLVCGNGGSSADSDHIVGELMKGFVKKRPLNKDFTEKATAFFGEDGKNLAANLQQGLPAISLTAQTALMTAFLNDCNPQYLYAQQVNALMRKGDVLIAVSTSGNAKNVAHAVRTAKILGGKTIGLTGNTGGVLKELADTIIVSPRTETYKIQEDHLPIYHLICMLVENEIFEGVL